MTGRNRDIWPPRNLLAIEADIGMPVLDYLFEAYAQTGSVARAAKWLVEDADSGVAFTTVKDWWTAACERDPSLRERASRARQEWVTVERLRVKGERIERRGLLREIGCVRNAIAGRHCKVDGAPLPETGKGVTCGGRCLELWIHLRYHLSDQHWKAHRRLVSARAVRRPDEYAPGTVAHAQRVIRGEETTSHGRWALSPLISANLTEVIQMREAAKSRWGDMAADLPTPQAMAKLNNRRPVRASASPDA